MTGPRFTLIDASNRNDHRRLTENDKCYFLGERTAGEGYDFSETNQLIANIKINPRFRGQNRWHYKDRDMTKCARLFETGLKREWLEFATLVPIPPSKMKSDPEFDDRILEILKRIRVPGLDVRELVVQRESMRASSQSPGNRPSQRELFENYLIDETLVDPAPRVFGIVDDVLTNGDHFKAVQQKLEERFPGVPTVGLFIARTVHRPDEFEDLDF